MNSKRSSSGKDSGESPPTTNEYNSALLRIHFSKIDHQQVPVINITDSVDQRNYVDSLKMSGTPFVLRGHKGWASFALRWAKKPSQTHSRSSSRTENSSNNTKNSLDAIDQGLQIDPDALIRDIGDEVVPVISPNYEGHNPIADHIPVKSFIEDCWVSKSTKFYLHQWQFPLAGKSIMKKLCFQCNPIPILGMDMLQYCYEPSFNGAAYDSPFQYIFMGVQDTYSKLHRDTGGLTITIAPIVGRKEVVMYHREDGRMLYHCNAPIYNPNFAKYPLSSFARSWKVEIGPGDILVMPAGTYHAARNVEACLSYSRFHLDQYDLIPFLNSWQANDSPTVHHREIVWNACIEIMKVVDRLAFERSTDSKSTVEPRVDTPFLRQTREIEERDAFQYICKLRHLVQAVIQISSDPNRFYSSHTMNVDATEWNTLLSDIDNSIKAYLASELSQHSFSNSRVETKRAERRNFQAHETSAKSMEDYGYDFEFEEDFDNGHNSRRDVKPESRTVKSINSNSPSKKTIKTTSSTNEQASPFKHVLIEKSFSLTKNSTLDTNLGLLDISALTKQMIDKEVGGSASSNQDDVEVVQGVRGRPKRQAAIVAANAVAVESSTANKKRGRSNLSRDDDSDSRLRIEALMDSESDDDAEKANSNGRGKSQSTSRRKMSDKTGSQSSSRNADSHNMNNDSSAKKKKRVLEVEEADDDDLSVHAPETGKLGASNWETLHDSRGNKISYGTIVRICGTRADAMVVETHESAIGCKVHYEGFADSFDEFVIASELRDMNGNFVDPSSIRCGSKVIALWGAFKDEYLATVLDWKLSEYAETQNDDVDWETASVVSHQDNSEIQTDSLALLQGHGSGENSASDEVIYRGPMVKVRFKNKYTRQVYHRFYPLFRVRRKARRPKRYTVC